MVRQGVHEERVRLVQVQLKKGVQLATTVRIRRRRRYRNSGEGLQTGEELTISTSTNRAFPRLPALPPAHYSNLNNDGGKMKIDTAATLYSMDINMRKRDKVCCRPVSSEYSCVHIEVFDVRETD